MTDSVTIGDPEVRAILDKPNSVLAIVPIDPGHRKAHSIPAHLSTMIAGNWGNKVVVYSADSVSSLVAEFRNAGGGLVYIPETDEAINLLAGSPQETRISSLDVEASGGPSRSVAHFPMTTLRLNASPEQIAKAGSGAPAPANG